MTDDPGDHHTVTHLARPHRLAVWVLALALCAGLRPLTADALGAEPSRSAAATQLTTRDAAATRCKKRRGHRRPRLTHVDGDIVGTRYGPVQVRVFFCGRRIVNMVALKDPDDLERSRQIDADALPKLRQQVLAAQSARIDGVSGATYTSAAYKQSLQSALDLA